MAVCAGPPATICCKPRQAWKGAAVATASCAGVWLVRTAALKQTIGLFLLGVSYYPETHLSEFFCSPSKKH
jgi:hypothetical protein